MKKLFLIIWLLLPALGIAQIPNGYYDSAAGLSGNALKIALHDIISNGFVSTQYDDLWDVYPITDKKANGKVWDMYSDIPGGTPPYEFTFVTSQCGSYNSENDCFNREHSVPQSWFGGASPMYSDIFHVVPTDGWVNSKRSNFPFGEVGSASWTSMNGSKLGSCDFPGYTGTVFEPIDSFKGDFARIYFYMCVRYKDEMPSWTSESFSGGDLSSWTENMFLQWHALDPVSQKEIDRNNHVHDVQFNRNPFVDNPSWVYSIWGPTAGTDEESAVNYFNVFPCPATNTVNLDFRNGIEPNEAYLFDLQGRKILNLSGEQSFSVEDLPSAFYVVKCIFSNIASEKALIVTH
jgi:endonuclease I